MSDVSKEVSPEARKRKSPDSQPILILGTNRSSVCNLHMLTVSDLSKLSTCL